jgi:hypothetical protein
MMPDMRALDNNDKPVYARWLNCRKLRHGKHLWLDNCQDSAVF